MCTAFEQAFATDQLQPTFDLVAAFAIAGSMALEAMLLEDGLHLIAEKRNVSLRLRRRDSCEPEHRARDDEQMAGYLHEDH